MGRPSMGLTKKLIGFDDESIRAVDEWRREQDPIPDFSEAVRKIIKSSAKPAPPKDNDILRKYR